MQTESEKSRQRVTEELESIVAELRAAGILPEEVYWKNTLVVSYEDREATLCFASLELQDIERKQLRQKLRKLLLSLAGASPVGFVS
jgi:hypothetical protein